MSQYNGVTNSRGVPVPAPSSPPGGSDTEIQFNSAGSFGATPYLNWDGASLNVNGVPAIPLPGTIVGWATTTPYPTAAWLACDGSDVDRDTYPNLFSAIGETFGVGDGKTTFTLPDLSSFYPAGIVGLIKT